MKKLILGVIAVLLLGAAPASALDPRDILKGLGGSDSTSQGGGFGALGDLIGNLTANNKFTVDDLVGSWSYTGPAVSFASENALKNVGGAAAATAVEAKLEPYYKRLGFTSTTLTVNEDHTFSMKMGLLQFKGTVEKTEAGQLQFNFTLLNRNVGNVEAHATKSGDMLKVTFDATKMIQMLNKASSVVNSASLKTLTKLLSSYDGIYMGYKMKREKAAGSSLKSSKK